MQAFRALLKFAPSPLQGHIIFLLVVGGGLPLLVTPALLATGPHVAFFRTECAQQQFLPARKASFGRGRVQGVEHLLDLNNSRLYSDEHVRLLGFLPREAPLDELRSELSIFYGRLPGTAAPVLVDAVEAS